ncbi:MAG: hypothetical protein AAF725_24120 [Acidobacteriota bacterium]
MNLSAEDLLAGGALTHRVEIPPGLLDGHGEAGQVEVRPLTVRSMQRIAKAGRDDEELTASLMLRESLVEPRLELEQIGRLPAGVARFLLDTIQELSGVGTPQSALEELVQAPLAKACFVLAKEFGWTPEQVSGMTVGQILLYVEMTSGERSEAG